VPSGKTSAEVVNPNLLPLQARRKKVGRQSLLLLWLLLQLGRWEKARSQGQGPKWPTPTSCTVIVFLQWPTTSGCAAVGRGLRTESSHVVLGLWPAHMDRLMQSYGSPCLLGSLG
jgi:hypothetical protein